MKKQITQADAEKILEDKYLKKFVCFTYPGFPPVYGLVGRILIGDAGRDKGLVLVMIGDKMYRVSPESLTECLKIVRNGNSSTGRTGPAEGVRKDD